MALGIENPVGRCQKARLAGLVLVGAALTFLLLWPGQVSAQPDGEWSTTLGGEADDFAHVAIQSDDGGYLVAGETGSAGTDSQDVWLVKLDANGNEEWARTFGGPLDDVGYDVNQTADGGYIVAGETHSLGTGSADKSDYWLIKIDSSGNKEWDRSYGNIELHGARNLTTSDVAHSVIQTSDFGYMVTGSTETGLGRDIWLVKTNSVGDLLWDSQIGGDLDENAFGVLEAADGGYITAGKTDSFGAGGSDYWLIKTDSLGAEQWNNTFGGEYNDEARAVVQTIDGGYALAGFSWSFGAGLSDFWLVKTDESGREEWNRSYGGVPRDDAHSLQQTNDGGYVMAGWSESFPGGDHVWVVKVGPFGNKQWDNTYGRPSGARTIQQTTDGGYLVAGWTGPLEGVRDIWVLKTLAEDLVAARPTGPVAVLENTGPAHVTSAAVGFNVPGSTGPYQFHFRGRALNTDNPLPPGSLACTRPLPDVASGSHLVLDQINSFGNGFIDAVTTSRSSPEVVIDAPEIHFDLTHEGVQGGSITGKFSFVSQSPCGEPPPAQGPTVPTGLTVTVSTEEPATLNLDWNDNTRPGTAGYRVYVGSSPTGPFAPVVPLESDSQHSDSRLTEGETYYYAVTAIDGRGRESAQSLVATGVSSDLIPPSAPTGLRLVFSDQTTGIASLDWSDNPDADLQSYRIYRRNGEGPFVAIGNATSQSGFTDQTLPQEGSFTYKVTAVDKAGNESVYSNIAPPEMDFFGTIIGIELDQVEGGLLVINTSRGTVETRIVGQTSVRLPQQEGASIRDLARGDEVAVALVRQLNRLVGDKVFVIPGKTVNRHVSGYVSDLGPGEITIQPIGANQDPITFILPPQVEIKFHQGTTELTSGAYVIISAISESRTGELSTSASEINVTTSRVPSQLSQRTGTPTVLARLNGVFQRIAPSNGNLILSGTEVALDAATQIAEGLVAGEVIEVDAELRLDGSLVARKVERDSRAPEIVEQTILEGLFGGVDPVSGQWLIGGTIVTVDHRTHTDGLPHHRQLVRVKALLQPDGSLVAREIENRTWSGTLQLGLEDLTLLEGSFSGINDAGNWIVGGLPVAVDSVTGLEGSPSVGRRVAVNAVLRDGRLVARNVSAIQKDENITVREVVIRGTVDRILVDGSMVVDGVRVLLSNLTEVAADPVTGGSVEIKALLKSNGILVARVIDDAPPENETGETRANPVDIKGKIQRVNDDGSLLVNGITVLTSALSDIVGAIQPGAKVQIRGIFQRNGAVLARDIRAEGRRLTDGETEARVEGVIERIFFDVTGNVGTFVVDGVTVAVDDLTISGVVIEPGSSVVVQTVVKNGVFLAATIEPPLTSTAAQKPTFEVQGTIEAIEHDADENVVSVFINGIEIKLGPRSRISGALEVWEAIELKGLIKDGDLVADRVDSADFHPFGDRASKFKLEGVIEEVRRDADGRTVGVRVDGERVEVEALTLTRGALVSGKRVVVEGVVRTGTLLAATIVEVILNEGLITREVR